jgi:hypothetical protein
VKVIRIFSLKQALSKSCPGPFNRVFRLGLDTRDNFIDCTPFCDAGLGVTLRGHDEVRWAFLARNMPMITNMITRRLFPYSQGEYLRRQFLVICVFNTRRGICRMNTMLWSDRTCKYHNHTLSLVHNLHLAFFRCFRLCCHV